MRAILFEVYGGPQVLELKEVAKPFPKEKEVLIRVKAASINSWDYEFLRGVPFANRAMFGLFRPKKINILGSDLAGVVEAVGTGVRKFKPGDRVFGDQSGGNWGGFAEYTCADENNLILKPDRLSFEEAACLPQAGLLALQALRDYGHVAPGERVLINGAGGGAGSFAIQLAKIFGAHVTAVDTQAKQEMMAKLGADHVIDCDKEDYTKTGTYDVIVDFMALRSIFDYKRALNRGGFFGLVGGRSGTIFPILIFGPLFGNRLRLVLHRANRGLEDLATLAGEGKIRSVIDRTFPLERTGEAFEYFASNHFNGKIVVTP